MRRGSVREIVDRGMGQFVWRFGVVCFGGLYFVASTLFRWLGSNPDYRYHAELMTSLVVVNFVYALSVGAAAGFIGWFAIRLFVPAIHSRSETQALKSRSAAANK